MPRVRYNVHDEGGIMNYGRATRVLARFGYEIAIRLDPRRLRERYRASDRSDCSRT
jgi:hypothetical protein